MPQCPASPYPCLCCHVLPVDLHGEPDLHLVMSSEGKRINYKRTLSLGFDAMLGTGMGYRQVFSTLT